MTNAKQLGITEFPYIERNSKGNMTYFEADDGSWWRCDYNSDGFPINMETHMGMMEFEIGSEDRLKLGEDMANKLLEKINGKNPPSFDEK